MVWGAGGAGETTWASSSLCRIQPQMFVASPGPGFGNRQRGTQKGETCWSPAAGHSPPAAQAAPLSLAYPVLATWSVRVELCSILSGSSLCVFLLPKVSWMSDREFLLPQGGLGAGPHVFSASGPREGLWGA